MKVPFQHVCSHVSGFLVQNFVPALFPNPWMQAAVGFAVANRTPNILSHYLDKPEFSMLGIVDKEKGEVDVEMLYQMATEGFKKQADLQFELPDLLGKGTHRFVIKQDDVNSLYKAITGKQDAK